MARAAGRTSRRGRHGERRSFDLAAFGAAASILFALMPQIGEQVDFLRFLPPRSSMSGAAVVEALLLGRSRLDRASASLEAAGRLVARLCWRSGRRCRPSAPCEPAQMYRLAFGYLSPRRAMALALTGALRRASRRSRSTSPTPMPGSLAWSNFFSRLTHSHPGRVVWLVFNVAIALLLMETRRLPDASSIRWCSIRSSRSAWLGALVGRSRRSTSAWASARRASSSSARISTTSIRSASARCCWRRSLARSAPMPGCSGRWRRHFRPSWRFGVGLRGGARSSPGRPAGDTISRASRAAWASRGDHPLLDLRACLRAGGHGLLPGLCRADLLALLLARRALPRCCKPQAPHRRAGRQAARRGAAARRSSALADTRGWRGSPACSSLFAGVHRRCLLVAIVADDRRGAVTLRSRTRVLEHLLHHAGHRRRRCLAAGAGA